METPDDAVPILACWVAPFPGGPEGACIAAIEVMAPVAADVERPRIDLVVAVDRSSSMVGPRIAAAVEAVRQICLRLGQGDRLGVVAFDADVSIVRAPGPVEPGTAREVAVSLAELGVGYGTNIAGGW